MFRFQAARGAAAIALLLNACASGTSGTSRSDNAAVNYAAGSPLGLAMLASDAAKLQPIFVQALSRGVDGERYDWRGAESFGWVKASAHRVGGLGPTSAALPIAPDNLALDGRFETDLGLFAVTRTANVRRGPSTDYEILTKLQSGDAVEAVGRLVGAPWLLIKQNDRIIGYLHESLTRRAPGAELDLAGGPTREALRCRSFEQRISYGGRSDRWEGVACLDAGGDWRLQDPPANQPVKLY